MQARCEIIRCTVEKTIPTGGGGVRCRDHSVRCAHLNTLCFALIACFVCSCLALRVRCLAWIDADVQLVCRSRIIDSVIHMHAHGVSCSGSATVEVQGCHFVDNRCDRTPWT